MKINNPLALQAAFHHELALMLKDDSTSKSDFKLSEKVHERAKELAKTSTVKEALKQAAEYHMSQYKKLKEEFEEKHKTSFDDFFAINEDAILDSFKISEAQAEAALFNQPEIGPSESEDLDE